MSNLDEVEAVNPEVISLIEKDSTENPFTEEMTGLPFMPASFGTGLPSRLRRDEAIGVINRVFREEGIALDSMVELNNGVTVTAEGYDEKMKMGYVFIDYYRLGEGTVTNNGYMNKKWKFNENYKSDVSYPSIKNYTWAEKYSYKWLVKENTPQSKAFIKFIDEVYPTLGSLQKENRFKRAYVIYSIYNELEKKASAHPAFVAELRQSMEEPDKISRSKLEKILSTLRVLKKTETTLITELISTIDQSDKKWGKQMNNLLILRRLKTVAINAKNDKLLQLIETAFATSGKAQQKIFKEIESTMDFIKVDLWEIQKIEIAADQREYFLAPISQRDHRFAYRQSFSRPHPEDIKLFEKQKEKEIDPVRKEKLKKRIDYLKLELEKEKVNPREKSLKLLEEQVRNYIHWAKSQMGY